MINACKKNRQEVLEYRHPRKFVLGSLYVEFEEWTEASRYFYRLRAEEILSKEQHHKMLQNIYQRAIEDAIKQPS